jgi:hypothetical protein
MVCQKIGDRTRGGGGSTLENFSVSGDGLG